MTTAPATDAAHGVWIGIDLGTSHCAAAVWDSRRGSPKWMRLGALAIPDVRGKAGRLMPSVLLFVTPAVARLWTTALPLLGSDGNTRTDESVRVIVGQQALDIVDEAFRTESDLDVQDVTAALLVGSKRKFAENGSRIQIIPLGSKKYISVDPADAAAILLQVLRLQCDDYLGQRRTRRKQLRVPHHAFENDNGDENSNENTQSDRSCRHVVVGVPAQWSQAARDRLRGAAQQAGFYGTTAHTIIESTAAALSYGLGINNYDGQNSRKSGRVIMVVDMGGGTTDITIANLCDHKLQVLLTSGDEKLGGNEMDKALLEIVKCRIPNASVLAGSVEKMMLRECRRAKEALSEQESHNIVFQGQTVTVTRLEMEAAITALLSRCKLLIKQALEEYQQNGEASHPDDVILIGGATKVPSVRQAVQEMFPNKELCLSNHPMSAVAQGTAIQAALISNAVPPHEIQSALMLDTVPHDIGVLLPSSNDSASDGSFVEVIRRGTSLPAAGTASFQLAHVRQAGVTVLAVERIPGNEQMSQMTFVDIGKFNFLLHRPSESTLKRLSSRKIDVGIKLDEHGAMIVSIFDPIDPEHQSQKRAVDGRQNQLGVVEPILYDKEHIMVDEDDQFTTEQVLLLAGCFVLLLLYVSVKIAFNEIPEDS